mgnify:CR=1 FL=1
MRPGSACWSTPRRPTRSRSGCARSSTLRPTWRAAWRAACLEAARGHMRGRVAWSGCWRSMRSWTLCRTKGPTVAGPTSDHLRANQDGDEPQCSISRRRTPVAMASRSAARRPPRTATGRLRAGMNSSGQRHSGRGRSHRPRWPAWSPAKRRPTGSRIADPFALKIGRQDGDPRDAADLAGWCSWRPTPCPPARAGPPTGRRWRSARRTGPSRCPARMNGDDHRLVGDRRRDDHGQPGEGHRHGAPCRSTSSGRVRRSGRRGCPAIGATMIGMPVHGSVRRPAWNGL